MIFTDIMKKRKNKIKGRAYEEKEIVSAVRWHLDEKIQGFDDTDADLKSKIKARLSEAADKAKSGASEREIERMASACNRLKMQIDLNDKKTDDFVAVREIVLDLEMYVEAIIDYEWYDFLVKVIPEKKLPEMVNNESELKKVIDLIATIIDKIELKMVHTIKDKEELERVKRQIKERATYMKAQYSNTRVDATNARDSLNDLMKEFGMESADFTMPASAPEQTNVNNENRA